jgi:hypothetical protein
MSDKKPATVKEVLIAELLGDIHTLLERLERVDNNTKATTSALNEATAQYRGQVDGMVAKLRAETANVIMQATEHAAKTLVGQQTETLQKAATAAMQKSLSVEVLKRTRRDWFAAIGLSATLSAVITALTYALLR